MKHTKKSFVSALLAVAMLITCFLSFGGVTADALSTDYTPGGPMVCYYYDYYPTLRESTLNSEFPGYGIYYDHQDLSTDGLEDLMYSGFYTGSEVECYIFDIKRSAPDGILLATLFSGLKAQGYKVVLVTSFDIAEFGSDAFVEYVDEISPATFDRLHEYADLAVDYFYGASDTNMENSCFMFESYHLGVAAISDYMGRTMESLCQESPFLRFLLDALADCLLSEDQGYDNYTYDNIAQQLHTRFNIAFYVHVSGSTYVDILSWQTHTFTDAYDILYGNECNYDRICAMGFTHFDSAFYNFLYYSQNNCTIPVLVYVMEVEPVTYSEDGLYGVVYSGGSFEETTDDDEERILVSALNSVLE